MSLFNNDTVICVCCKERVNRKNIVWLCDNIGICDICGKTLMPIPEKSPFEGTSDIKFLLSAYYYNDTLKNLVQRYKFFGEHKLGELFAVMLYDYLKDFPLKQDFDFITAVPLHRKRFLFRGYNQAEIIAKLTAKKLDIPYVPCIYRCTKTMTQSSLKKHERLHNTRNSFIADKTSVTGKHILLFDDIFTTGSTASSCARELKDKGALSVAGISFARASFYSSQISTQKI